MTALLCGLLFLLAFFVWRDLRPPPSPSYRPLKPYVPPDVGLHFHDVAQQAGLRYRWSIPGKRPLNILQSIGNGCAFLDYNSDGNLDILLVGPKLALYKGDGRGHFIDVTHATGLDKFHGHFLGCAVGDYDNDGYDDIYISGYHTALLLHNEHGHRFKDVTGRAGLLSRHWGLSAAWADVDGDGLLDLYVCNYHVYPPPAYVGQPVPKTSPTPASRSGGLSIPASLSPLAYPVERGKFYRNQGEGRFEAATDRWHAQQVTGHAMTVAFADYDGSGRPSAYIGNDGVNADLLENRGKAFTNVGVRSGVARMSGIAYSGMGADWGDYDNDGRLDLAVGTFEQQPKLVFHNDGDGLFTRQDNSLGMAPRSTLFLSFGTKWFDADNDGWLDLIFANGHVVDFFPDFLQPVQLFHNDHGRRFSDVTGASGEDLSRAIFGRGLAVGDYDNDGREDVMVVDSEGAPLLLHNESGAVGHWLTVTLQGVRSNRDGYGARVTVKAGGLTQTRLCHADGSYLSSSDKRVHIGLGRALKAERMIIHWPSGHTDTYMNVPADRFLVVREGSPTVALHQH